MSRSAIAIIILVLPWFVSPVQTEERTEAKSYTARPGDTLVINNDFGRIRVRPCNGAVLELRIRKVVADPAQKGFPEVLVQKTGAVISVNSSFTGAPGEAVDFEVSAPGFLNVTISGANPEVDIAGIQGLVDVKDLSGRVVVENLSAATALSTGGGDIVYRASTQPRGDVRLESVSGSINCEIEDGLNLHSSLRAGGKVFWDMDPVVEAASVEKQVGTGGPQLSAESRKGNVVVRLRPAARVNAPIVPAVTATAGETVQPDREVVPAPSKSPASKTVQPPAKSAAGSKAPDGASIPRAAGSRVPPRAETASERGAPRESAPREEPSPEIGAGGYSLKVNVDSVFLNVSVLDRGTNRSITGLQKRDFLVYEDGVQQTVDQVAPAEAPFNLLLLLDVSGSTQSFLELMKQASIDFTRQLKASDLVAIAVFNSGVHLLQEFTNDRAAAARSIGMIHSGGGTAFYDALMTCIDQYMRGIEGRSAIVVFTDGVDNQLYGNRMDGSRATFDELYRRIQEIEPLIYTIFLDTQGQVPNVTRGPGTGPGTTTGTVVDVLGGILRGRRYPGSYPDPRYPSPAPYPAPAPNPPPGPYPAPGRGGSYPGGPGERAAYEAAREQLMTIAEQTGGRMYAPYRIEELSRVYSEIAGDLRVQYQLGYNSTNRARDGRWREIRVRIEGRPEAAVRTRKGYYARKD